MVRGQIHYNETKKDPIIKNGCSTRALKMPEELPDLVLLRAACRASQGSPMLSLQLVPGEPVSVCPPEHCISEDFRERGESVP